MMNKQEAQKRVHRLKQIINRHRYLYHVLDRSQISPAALDSLKKELFDLEQRFPDLITKDSPTQRVAGEPLAEFQKTRHEQPMLSFNDAFSEEDMLAWLTRLQNYLGRPLRSDFYCELKIDGLAIELVYENGVLIQGSTRGDGFIGEDVTQNLKTIEAIPLQLENQKSKISNQKLIVRGEVFLTKKEFARINSGLIKEGKTVYANPRNLAAGTIRQLDPKIAASRKLDSFAYDILGNLGLENHEQEHEALKNLGFKTNPHNKKMSSLKEMFAFRNYWEKHREKLPYEVDGVVVIVNKNSEFETGGVVGKAPRSAVAFKFSAREATTAVEEIKVQVGRTGVLTPVAVLRPVAIGGITISHASLHNADEIERLKLKIGDTVIVSRAGDVIPKIIKVLSELRTGREKKFQMPEHCPADGSRVIKEGALHHCSNPECGARRREFLYHFVSRGAFNIEGLGQKIIDRFLDEGLIGDAADIFTLKKGDIEILERFGEKSARNIVAEIAARKKISWPRLLYALGIPHVGEETARTLIRAAPDWQTLAKLSVEELQKLPDIGPKSAQSIRDWFHEPRHTRLIEKLEKAGIEIENQDLKIKNQKFSGKIFVLTGTLRSMNREEVKEKIRALGGEVSESVSKTTNYLVAGEEPGSKLDKARKSGVKIVAEREFLTMIT